VFLKLKLNRPASRALNRNFSQGVYYWSNLKIRRQTVSRTPGFLYGMAFSVLCRQAANGGWDTMSGALRFYLDWWDSAVTADDAPAAASALTSAYAISSDHSSIYWHLFRSSLPNKHASTIVAAARILLDEGKLPAQGVSDILANYYRAFAAQSEFWASPSRMTPVPEKVAELEAAVRRDLSLDYPIPYLYLGGVHVLRNEFEAARACFDMAASKKSVRMGWRFYDTGCMTWIPPRDGMPWQGRDVRRGTGLMLRRPPADRLATIVFVGDGRYIEAFLPGILRSARQQGGASLHFHVINPKNSTLDALSRHNVGVSVESTVWKDKAYLTIARLFKAAWLLEALDRPIAIFDLDIQFKSSIDKYLRAAVAEDVALTYNHGSARLFPWLHYNAGAIFLNNTENGRAFAELLSARAPIHYLEGPDPMWWVDQAQLQHCAFAFRQARPNVGIASNRHLPLPWDQDGDYKRAVLSAFDRGRQNPSEVVAESSGADDELQAVV